MKSISYKYGFILLSFLVLTGCLSGQRPSVRLSPDLDKRLYQITPLPITVGLYIEPNLRNFVQEAPLRQYEAGTPRYVFPNFVFPIGKPLSSKLEETSKILFKKVLLIDNLQNNEYLSNESFDGVLSVSLKDSEIELYVEESVGRAVGRHNLSVTASFLDSELIKIWESDISVEGKGLDFVTSKVEYEWWMTTGPNFAPAVDDAIQKITYALAQKIAASEEISDYVYKKRQ